MLFLESVRKGQTDLTIQAQNYKRQSEARMLTLIMKENQLQSDVERLSKEGNSLKSELASAYDHSKQSQGELHEVKQKLELVEPKLEKTLEEQNELKAEIKRI